MIVLGIETAAELVGVALADDDGLRAGVWVRGSRRHAESLAPAVTHVLEQAGLPLRRVEAVAVDVGPGLFTGLRVGVATAQGLAQGLGIGVVGVTSLDVLAHAAYEGGWPGPVAAVVDARRGEVFAATYRAGSVPDRPPARYAPAELAGLLGAVAAEAGHPVLAVGTGARRYPDDLGPAVPAGASLAEPSPGALVAVATGRLADGEPLLPPDRIRPVYLREPDATINWATR
ncbi:MAG: tRNA (adenosine(37)-N6)-threonylcarbamoyltransferase complex dimerization subunit type 1 TsaB [Acidimicrobiales bacterium]